MNEVILTVKALSSSYGPIEVLKQISIEIRKGEIVTLIGANGAGKTTTLMCVSRVQPITSGKIIFETGDLTLMEPDEVVKNGIAHVPEGRRIFARMTVRENLELGAYIHADPTIATIEEEKVFELFPILKERYDQLAGTLSGGEQQMLAIGRALMSRPKLLILDEPSMGIAPILVEKIFETIKSLNQTGLTIFLVEQNAHMALQVASRGYVIETGQIVLADSAKNLLNNPRVKEAYLGG